MAQVLDYVGRPGAAEIKAKGYAGAVRYIGYPDRPKCTNAAELADFTAHGIGMALVFENTITDWRGGYDAGHYAGVIARKHATDIRFPTDRPIYAAIDQDVVSSGEFGTMLDYLRGFAAAQGGAHLAGVYGEADVIDRARNAGVVLYFWQTAAWSRGRRTDAHLFQHVGTVYVGGVACDENDVLAPDWGQHTEDTMSEADAWNGVANLIRSLARDDGKEIRKVLVDVIAEGAWDGVANMLKAVKNGEAEDIKGILQGLQGVGVTSDQLRELATLMDAGVAASVCDEQDRRTAARSTTKV